MEDVDTRELTDYDDEEMFLHHVVGEEHELLMLDSYLKDVFGNMATLEEATI